MCDALRPLKGRHQLTYSHCEYESWPFSQTYKQGQISRVTTSKETHTESSVMFCLSSETFTPKVTISRKHGWQDWPS